MIKVYNANRHYDRLYVIWDGEKYIGIDLEMPTLALHDENSIVHVKVQNGNYREVKPSDDRYAPVVAKYRNLHEQMVIHALLSQGEHRVEEGQVIPMNFTAAIDR